MSSLDSRLAAVYILKRFRKQRAWASETITSAQSRYELDPRDTALAAILSKSVLEHESLIDFYLEHFSSIPLNRLDEEVLDLLRIGTVQILYMDRIPDSAAVDTAVSGCRTLGRKKACGFVNAVLRSIIRNKNELPVPDSDDPAAGLALRYTHPKWLVQRLIQEYGSEHTEAFLKANNEIDSRSLYVNTLITDSDQFISLLQEHEISYVTDPQWPESVQIPQMRRVDQLPGFHEGMFYVQDPAAHEVSSIAGVSPNISVLDCCAAPGGKTISSSIKMENTGSVTACDIHEKKLKRIMENCSRLHITNVECRAHDAREALSGSYDVVLADVPCSGMGVIRKRPEIRYKREEEILSLPQIQFDILSNVSRNVKPGGTLVYSTCTVLKEENEDVIKHFLSSHSDFKLVPFTTFGQNCDGMITYWPQLHHTDGFFVCKMKKTS
ncbi:MAG: 16S rRNA (cytosine(967)-C(5))-methyltransferase RsmB [Lachnospiraceae bacterium]|nr:16S rRNA (cytosine(967)-C(5))-methyltransferase RsmB [Lachnospiraceae bacterium]